MDARSGAPGQGPVRAGRCRQAAALEHPHIRPAVEDRLARELAKSAHTFAVELDRRDVVTEWKSDDRGRPPVDDWTVMVEARWQPSVAVAEMLGGYLDGQRFTLQVVGEPVEVSLAPAAPSWASDAAPVPRGAMTYELSGWRETERVWVYSVRSTGRMGA